MINQPLPRELDKVLGESADRYGKYKENHLCDVLNRSNSMPDWFGGAEVGSLEDDGRGIDVRVHMLDHPKNDLLIQVKSSQRGVREFAYKYISKRLVGLR
jgi:hypothetical protein